MQIISSIVIALFYAIVISIPVFIVFTLVRGAKSNTEVANTQKDIKRLLEEVIAEQKKNQRPVERAEKPLDGDALWLDMALDVTKLKRAWLTRPGFGSVSHFFCIL